MDYTRQINQHAKKVVPDTLGLENSATGLVNSVHELPNGHANLLGEFKLQKKLYPILLINLLGAINLM